MFYKKKFKEEIPVLGLGCMRLPRLSSESTAIDYKRAQQMVDYAYEKGIRYFDTAYPYHDGESEIFVGKALKKYNRCEFLLATKMPIWECNSLDDVKKMFYSQLERLQVEYFDFYLCHALNLSRHNEYIKYKAYEFLEEMKKEGKIRYLGFSYHDLPQNLKVIATHKPWDFAQLQINYLDWQLIDAKSQYETLEKLNIPCIVMEPVRGGMLANITQEAEDIFKNKDPEASVASWALRYVASMKNIMVVLSGMSNMEQLEDNIKTFTNFKPLDSEEQLVVEKAKNAILGNDFIPCTGCQYCMPCPFNVNISKNFRLFNMLQINKKKEVFMDAISKMDKTELASNCHECKVCLKKCPQYINIVEELKKVSLSIGS